MRAEYAGDRRFALLLAALAVAAFALLGGATAGLPGVAIGCACGALLG